MLLVNSVSRPAQAVSGSSLALLNAPVELERLRPGSDLPDASEVITANTISQTGITVPSLWFIQEQVADQFSSRLVENWLAYPGSETTLRRIDLVVNPQVWSLLNYLERYTFLHRFGSTARDYRYSMRVFDPQARLLAAYLCDYDTEQPSELTARHAASSQPKQMIPAAKSLPECTVVLDSAGAGGLRGRTNPFGGVQPIDATAP